MERGWDASGKLERFWGKVGGRDGLAAATGIKGPTLSGYNAGSRSLGITNARRIADALRVSLLDLGAPEGAADDPQSRTLADRLEALSAKVAELGAELVDTRSELEAAQARLDALEAARATRRSGPAPKRKAQ